MNNVITFESLGLSFNLSRVAFQLFGKNIYWYGIIIATGLILAYIYASYAAEKEGISQDDFLNLFLIAVPMAIVGARLYYCIFNFSSYKDDLWEIFNIREGGLAVYGGIIAAVAVILIYCRIRKIRTAKILDILAVGLLIGQCIGRWGNFFNGEAFGSPAHSIFAMTIVTDGKTVAENVHPTFLYESAWNFIGIIVLTLYKKKQVFPGELFSMYMVWYGLGRMVIEGLRSDSLYLGGIRVSQLLSLVILIAGMTIIIYNRRKKKLES